MFETTNQGQSDLLWTFLVVKIQDPADQLDFGHYTSGSQVLRVQIFGHILTPHLNSPNPRNWSKTDLNKSISWPCRHGAS